MSRFAIFVHNPDADMGDGMIVGPFKLAESAERRARLIERQDDAIECVVLPLVPYSTSAKSVADMIVGEGGHTA